MEKLLKQPSLRLVTFPLFKTKTELAEGDDGTAYQVGHYLSEVISMTHISHDDKHKTYVYFLKSTTGITHIELQWS